MAKIDFSIAAYSDNYSVAEKVQLVQLKPYTWASHIF